MKAQKSVVVNVTLEVSKDEARFIMDAMRNPIHEGEDKDERETRFKIFTALNDILDI